MKSNIQKFIYTLALSIVIFSCQKEDNIISSNSLDGLSKLKEGYAIGASAKVEIWGKKNFFVGYNNLVVVLYDSLNLKEKITDAHIHFMPLMTMSMMGQMPMVHAAPVENPSETPVNDVFPGAVAFIMPSTETGVWQLRVAVHNHKYDKEGTASFNINVDSPTNSSLTVFTTTTDSLKLVLSMVQPTTPKVGMNDIEFTIHQKAGMMDFPADDSYAIEITPEMPSMGHGSPNNVNPTNTGNGHYKGKVNFTMTGEWKINVVVKKNGVAVSQNLYFNVVI
ncbi:MAG: FixH family protein [Bacteroidales bacterium]|nr:FixH family protein [Bacteroidales bacterium]